MEKYIYTSENQDFNDFLQETLARFNYRQFPTTKNSLFFF